MYESSNLKTIQIPDSDITNGWMQVKAHCSFLTDWGVELLRSGLDGHVKTILIEPKYICKDYRNLFSQFYSKKFVERAAYCSRLHFFSKPGLSVDDIWSYPNDFKGSYLGYSVIQPVKDRCIGRTIIDPFKIGKSQNTFYCLRTDNKVHINGVEYHVCGYPYFSQSSEATVCAHVSLWGVCRYLSQRYSKYAEVYPYDIIEMTNSAPGRRVPYRGMTYSDYSEILGSFGCFPVVIRPRTDQKSWSQDQDAFHDIYAYVESGFPVLVSYKGHVATIIGHTIQDNIGIHAPDNMKVGDSNVITRFHNSFSLMKQFVIIDDNFFPYKLLGYPSDSENYGAKFKTLIPTPSIDSIYATVIPLPEKAFLPPAATRALAYRYFHRGEVLPLLDKTITDLGLPTTEPLISRLFLTSSIAFKRRKGLCATGKLVEGEKPDRLSSLAIDLNLPHFIWVMEISPLSLFNKGKCIGEIVIDASTSMDECEFVYMRVGNTIFYNDDQNTPSDGLQSYLQYTHNLGERYG